ncbi:MAG: DUF6179 domain-containing protein [Clostridiales bacterium]|nr:DUF6179 domain-containing protein [Clostridiales bacterium]
MNTDIKKQTIIDKSRISKSQYLSNLLQEALRHRLLSDDELKQIQIQIVELLSKQVDRFTGKESSSLKVETAQELLQSTLYLISLYLKTIPDADLCVELIKKNRIKEFFDKGRQVIKKQIIDTQLLFKAVLKNRIITDVIAYNDTIDHAIPEFFLKYDSEFGSHETTASIDYPLCLSNIETTGIEYISEYLKKLYYENFFCKKFSEKSVNELLFDSDKNYQDLLFNVFEIILFNSIGSVLLNRSAYDISLSADDLNQLSQKMILRSKTEIELELSNSADKLMNELNISNTFLREYILETMMKMSSKFTGALKNDQLDILFVQHKERDREHEIRFEDGGKLDDEKLRKLIDIISAYDLVEDKISVIKTNIHSITDLIDILESCCIFEEEYISLFESLNDFELALLLNQLPIHPQNEDFASEKFEKEWQDRFVFYLKQLDTKQLKNIKDLSEKITMI